MRRTVQWCKVHCSKIQKIEIIRVDQNRSEYTKQILQKLQSILLKKMQRNRDQGSQSFFKFKADLIKVKVELFVCNVKLTQTKCT